MPGALRLAGEAALRVGAGLVRVAGPPENLVAVTATRPELIYLPVSSVTSLEEPMRAADVLAIGPGLGTSDWAHAPVVGRAGRGRAGGGRRRRAESAGAESGEVAGRLDHHSASRRSRAVVRYRTRARCRPIAWGRRASCIRVMAR